MEEKKGIGEALVQEAMEAYGIDKRYALVARYDAENEMVVIVTAGGKKLKYRAGDGKREGFRKPSKVEITGVNPEARERKPVAGKKRK